MSREKFLGGVANYFKEGDEATPDFSKPEEVRQCLWLYPEVGVTLKPEYRFCQGDPEDEDRIAENAVMMIFLESAIRASTNKRKLLGLQGENETNEEFYSQFVGQVDDLATYTQFWEGHEIARIQKLPRNGRELTLFSIGALSRYIAYSAELRIAVDTRSYERKTKNESFGLIKGTYEPLLLWDLEKMIGRLEPVVLPTEWRKVFEYVKRLVSAEGERKIYDELKIQNVVKALNYVNTVDQLSEDVVLEINRIVLQGLDQRAGIIRETAIVAGGDKRGSETLKPEEIRSALGEVIRMVNRFSPEASLESRQRRAAQLAARYQYIHPTYDGNGRTGHVVMQLVMRKLGLSQYYVPFEANSEYIDALDEVFHGRTEDLIKIFEKYQIN